MRSPPSSSPGGMFFSSPPRYTGSGPEEEVETLLAAARKVNALNDNLAVIVDSNNATFLEVFARHVQLLKSRSQAFEDAHVTVYDKVLLLLTDHGNSLESPAAITWYCVEFLGINLDSEFDRNTKIVEQVLATHIAASQGSELFISDAVQQAKYTQALTPSSSRNNSTISPSAVPKPSGKALGYPDSKNDPRFTHLWSVYSRAHVDYLAVADKHDSSTLEAARFLRDTAENGIHYLQEKYPKDSALTELNNTYKMAKAVVVNLKGGKKRKFDRETETDERSFNKSFLPHTVAHDRTNAERRRRDRDCGRNKPRGRGPSGIPYGYTRPVDSYYPG